MDSISKATVVLHKYRHYFPKSLVEVSTPRPSIAPYHPAVDPYHVDDKWLRAMNAADYCHSVKYIIRRMKGISAGLYSEILHNKYLLMDPITNIDQARRMHVSKKTFYRKLHHAIKLFTEMINGRPGLLDYLYKKAIKQ